MNTLGMKFVPVPGTEVLFCTTLTQVKDYAAYAAATPGLNTGWKNPSRDGVPFTQLGEDAVTNVTWDNAKGFCVWLGKRDGRIYRLPTDREWSVAVGIGHLEAAGPTTTPGSLNGKVPGVFPWGTQWPPPPGAGNYADTSYKQKFPTKGFIAGYTDGFVGVSPVTSFKPNIYGLYDMSGNLWQWCEDWYDAQMHGRVMRGGSWVSYERAEMLSSHRLNVSPDQIITFYARGFRCVVELSSLKGGNVPLPVVTPPRVAAPVMPAAAQTTPAQAAKDKPFVNSLGMKFVPVPGTKVLFCIHETRRQDYAAYATEDSALNDSWKKQHRAGVPCGDQNNHPVCGVSWLHAQKYCEWLSRKEGRVYRLPTDEEWSIAVGLGGLEKHSPGITPEMLSARVVAKYPWDGNFPPKSQDHAGNYRDASWQKQFPSDPGMAGYTDGFPTTSPVMSFKPNKFGLYDLGGNVWEWVEDWWNAAHQERVVRGASFYTAGSDYLLSSYRFHLAPTHLDYYHGFRCVLEPGS